MVDTPSGLNLLAKLYSKSYAIISVGKIDDVFAYRYITTSAHTSNNKETTDKIVKFWTRLEKGKFDPVYLLYGQEEFLIREAGSKIEASFLGPEANKFQYHHLYGNLFAF